MFFIRSQVVVTAHFGTAIVTMHATFLFVNSDALKIWVSFVGIWVWALVHGPIQIMKFSWPIHA
jgi:hypothetical protein